MYRLLEWIKQYRLEVIAAKAAAKNRQTELLVQLATQQQQFFQSWLTNWQTIEVPDARVVRDEDKVWEENNRIYNSRQPEIDEQLLREIEQSLHGGSMNNSPLDY